MGAVTGRSAGRTGRGSVAKKAGVIVFSKAFGHVARMLAIVILARILEKSDFGRLSFVLLTYIAVTELAQAGLPESVYFFFEKLPRTVHRNFVLLVAKVLFFISFACAIVLLAVGAVASWRGYEVMGFFLPLVFLPFLELPTIPLIHILIAVDRARTAAWFDIVFSATLFASLVVPSLAGRPVETIAYTLLGYGAVRLVLSAFVFARHFRGPGGSLPERMMVKLISYSLPLGLAQFMWKLNQVVDKYVVMYFLPAAVFAEYSVGSWEIPLVPLIASSVGAVMMPQFVSAYLQGRKKDLLSAWTVAIEKVAVIVLPLMVLFVVIARELVIVLFSERYLGTVLVFQIYTLILFQRVTAYDAVLRAINRTQVITAWAFCTVALNVLLSIPLVMSIGMVGAALSTLIATAVTWVYVLKKIGQGLDVKFSEVFPFAFYFRVLLVSSASALPAIMLHVMADIAPIQMLLGKALLYVASFMALSSCTGVCGPEEWRYLRSMVSRRQKAGDGVRA